MAKTVSAVDLHSGAIRSAADIFVSWLPLNNRATNENDEVAASAIVRAYLSALPDDDPYGPAGAPLSDRVLNDKLLDSCHKLSESVIAQADQIVSLTVELRALRETWTPKPSNALTV